MGFREGVTEGYIEALRKNGFTEEALSLMEKAFNDGITAREMYDDDFKHDDLMKSMLRPTPIN